MLIELTHRTTYTYSSPVRLDPQLLRLKPRDDAAQTLRHFEMAIAPASARTQDVLDGEGNVATRVTVEEPVVLFEIVTRARVETRAPPAPELALRSSHARVPFRDPTLLPDAARAFLASPGPGSPVERFACEVAQGADWETIPFLHALALRIHRSHAYRLREEGEPWTGAVTLAKREGACRDFAVLFIEACRVLGLPARFVSGYRLRDADGRGRELHAWAEAYLPGAGWCGFDPTIGRAVADRHVAVASGTVAGCAPVTGSFWGSQVTSRLSATVDAWWLAPGEKPRLA